MIPRILRMTIPIALWVLPPSIAGAQVGQDSTDLGAPDDEHRKLGVLVGTWDVVVSFPAGPGRRSEGEATCEVTWALDGRFLRQEYSSMFGGKPLTVVRYLGFDRHRGVYVEIQFESTRTDVMHTEGTISADGRILTASGRHVHAITGEVVGVRTVTTIVDDDSFTLEMFYGDTEDPDAPTIALTYRRSRDSSSP